MTRGAIFHIECASLFDLVRLCDRHTSDQQETKEQNHPLLSHQPRPAQTICLLYQLESRIRELEWGARTPGSYRKLKRTKCSTACRYLSSPSASRPSDAMVDDSAGTSRMTPVVRYAPHPESPPINSR